MSRNPTLIPLRLLRYEAEDDGFIQIFSDFARLLERAEDICNRAQPRFPDDDQVPEEVLFYMEELIGMSFLLLQAKIRRVTTAAERLRNASRASDPTTDLALDRKRLMLLGGRYKDTRDGLIGLIWDVANFYKHRDEWSHEEWVDDTSDPPDKGLEARRKTRRQVQQLGTVRGKAAGNMRTALTFFGIYPYSQCTMLASEVQDWALKVYKLAQSEIQRCEKR